MKLNINKKVVLGHRGKKDFWTFFTLSRKLSENFCLAMVPNFS